MSLKEKLLAAKPRTVRVTVDDMEFVVQSIGRVAKSELVLRCTGSDGKLNNARFEGEILAACVLDPETMQPVLSSDQWDVPAYVSGPLVEAACDVCGFSAREKLSVKTEAQS